MATRTMEEVSKEARRKRRHSGRTEDKSRAFLLLLTSALVLVNVGAEPQGAGEPIPVTRVSNICAADLEFVATVATGGRVKVLSAV